MLNIIAVQRFPSEFTDDSPATAQKVTEKVRQLTLRGPLNAPEAVASGLVTGTAYKAELLENVLGVPRVTDEQGQDEDLEDRVDRLKEASEKRMRGFYHYYKINEKEFEKAKKKEVLNVGVVYVLGTIGDVGECVLPRAHECRPMLKGPVRRVGSARRQSCEACAKRPTTTRSARSSCGSTRAEAVCSRATRSRARSKISRAGARSSSRASATSPRAVGTLSPRGQRPSSPPVRSPFLVFREKRLRRAATQRRRSLGRSG